MSSIIHNVLSMTSSHNSRMGHEYSISSYKKKKIKLNDKNLVYVIRVNIFNLFKQHALGTVNAHIFRFNPFLLNFLCLP